MKAISTLLPLLAWASAASAQTDTINVIGRKPEEVRREAQAFVRAVGVTDLPVARWIEPVCPKVVGVAPAIAERVIRRIGAVAGQVGVRMARGACDGNLMISFTTDAGAVVKQIASRLPDSFKDLDMAERAALQRGSAPIRWWHVTQMRTKDGMRDMGNEVPPSARLDGPGGVPLAGDVHQQYRSSFASTQMIRVLRAATIVVDVNKAEGTPLDSVIDLAALVGLAEIRPGAEPPPNSILALYERDGPKQLTQLDLNFLTALYRLPLDRTAIAHRGLLVKGIVNPAEK